MELHPGRHLDRFTLLRLLGSGGGADAWEVQDLSGRRLALKLPHPQVTLSERLLREGRLQSLLEHPNLLPVLEVLELNGRPALLMPLVEGPSLRALLGQRALSRSEALSLMRCVVEGVTHAHAAGLVHRDLKPSNVLLQPGPEGLTPLVADFGVAKPARADGLRTDTGVLLGTPAYMAPEQLQDASRVDPRADLWSLGVMLYELLAGRLPFPAESLPELLRAWHSPLDASGLEEEDAGLIAALLQVEPAARLPDGATLLACLEALRAPPGPSPLSAQGTLSEATQAWAPPPAPPLQLPTPPTDFVGRREDLTHLSAALVAGPGRLLTLTGPGGMGKTRLAIELARRSAAAWSGGVCFIDLSQAEDRAGLLDAAARALGLAPDHDPAAQVEVALRARGRALVVLDNLEQLLPFGVAALVESWLDAAPSLTLLLTSRAPTQAQGEQVHPVRPLSAAEAEALFLRRARAARPDLRLQEEDAPTLSELLRLLDGLPLALELAAARCRSMTLADLLAHLDQRWQLLRTRSRQLPPRQRALRAALQGSWDLLDPEAQRALATLSVFEGGFTPEAAAATLDASALATHELLDALEELGLLELRQGPRGPRGRLLFAVKAFAKEQLAEPEAPRLRHARYFAALPLGPRESLPGPHERLLPELENLLLAARTGAARQDAEVATETARKAAQLAARVGTAGAALSALERALGLPELTPEQRGRAGWARAQLLHSVGRDAQASAEGEGLLASPLPAPLRCALLVLLARVELALLNAEACDARLAEAQRLDDALSDPWLSAGLLRVRALRLLQQNDCTRGLRAAERAVTAALEAGDLLLELDAQVAKRIALQRMGRLDEAAETLQRILALARALRRPDKELYAHSSIGDHAWAAGDLAACRAGWQECLRLSERMGASDSVRHNRVNLAALDFREGRLEEAERSLRAALRTPEHPDLAHQFITARTNLGYLCHRLGRTDEGLPLLHAALAQARAREQRRALAILSWIAVTCIESGRFAEAEEALAELLAVTDPTEAPKWAATARDNLGLLRMHRGDLGGAEPLLRESVSLHGATGMPFYHSIAACHLGALLSDVGAYEEAGPVIDEALALSRRAGLPVVEGHALSLRGLLHAREGEHARARSRLKQAGALLTPTRDQPELLLHELRCAEAAQARGEGALARAFLKGAALRLSGLHWRPKAYAHRHLEALQRAQSVTL